MFFIFPHLLHCILFFHATATVTQLSSIGAPYYEVQMGAENVHLR
jgi:hypothetical protein